MDQNKRTLLAVALSAAVFLAWSIFFPGPKPTANQPAASNASAKPAVQAAPADRKSTRLNSSH